MLTRGSQGLRQSSEPEEPSPGQACSTVFLLGDWAQGARRPGARITASPSQPLPLQAL